MLSASARTLITRNVLPWRWKGDLQHAACVLKRFSEVEFDSAWQYMNAMQFVDSPQVKLMLFENLLEEMSHSDAFVDVGHKLARSRFESPCQRRLAIVGEPGDIPYFLAFAHESEKSICEQFIGYARACRSFPAAAAVFEEIAIDEQKHEENAHASLVGLIGSAGTVRRLLWRVKLRKAYASWMRGSQRIGDCIALFWFALVFYGFGAFLQRYCLAHLRGGEEKHHAFEPQRAAVPTRHAP